MKKALIESKGYWRDEYHSKVIETVLDTLFNLIITVCDNAKETCPMFPKAVKWFYLGVFPLITGIINWCPLAMKMGTCDPASGCCASDTKETSQSACCVPKTDAATAAATNIKSFSLHQL